MWYELLPRDHKKVIGLECKKGPSCVEELADMCKMFLDLYITSLFLIGLDFGRQNKMMSMLLMMSNKGLCRKQGSNIIFPDQCVSNCV